MGLPYTFFYQRRVEWHVRNVNGHYEKVSCGNRLDVLVGSVLVTGPCSSFNKVTLASSDQELLKRISKLVHPMFNKVESSTELKIA